MTFAPVLVALALSTPQPAATTSLAAGQSSSQPPEEVRAQVSGYLGAIHRPVPVSSFAALGPSAVDALADFALSDPMPVRRIRALEALAGLGGPRALAIHQEVLADAGAPTAVRRGAVRGLARLVGPNGATAALVPTLEKDPDPAVRAAAAEALARTAPAAACDRIRTRARVDAEPARLTRAVDLCDHATAEPGR